MSSKDYITITEGMFDGVSYRIRDAEFVEEGDKNLIKFDYDVKGLREEDTKKFEDFMSKMVLQAIEYAVQTDEENNK